MIFQGGFEINLDHRKLKTPQAKLFTVPSEALAIAVATEWDSQQDTIKFYTMHLVTSSHTYTPMPAVGFLGTWQKWGDSYPNYNKALGDGCCLTCPLECAKHWPPALSCSERCAGWRAAPLGSGRCAPLTAQLSYFLSCSWALFRQQHSVMFAPGVARRAGPCLSDQCWEVTLAASIGWVQEPKGQVGEVRNPYGAAPIYTGWLAEALEQ